MFELPKLNYAYNALEPVIDEATLRVHHGKHHHAYLDKFNAVLEKYPGLEFEAAEDFLINLENLKVSGVDKVAIKNNAGGFANHNLFFGIMGPGK